MTAGAPILISLLVAVFLGGAALFYGVTLRRGMRAALIGWGVCGAIVLMLAWGAAALDISARSEIFTTMALPVWLAGAFLGLVIGVIRQKLRRR